MQPPHPQVEIGGWADLYTYSESIGDLSWMEQALRWRCPDFA